jgi:hypothetical protein
MLLFAFQTLTSGWFLILCLIAAAGLTFLLYRREALFPKPWKYVLPALRFLGLFFLFLLLLSPFVVYTLQQEEKPTLLVYLDKSASAAGQVDAVYEQSLKQSLSQLAEKFTVRTYHFADKVYKAGDTVKGLNATELGQVSGHVNDYKDTRSVSAVLVVSDGIQNRSISPLLIPLHSNPTVYCLGVGDTTPRADIRIAGIQVNESVFLGSDFTVEVQLQCNAGFTAPYKLELWEGSTLVQTQNGTFESGNAFKRIAHTIKAKSPGLKQFRVVVSSLPGEKNLANNQATAVTEVVDDRKKVTLVMAAPHPDLGAIKRLLESNARYQVSMADPGLMPAPGSADVFVIHGMPVNDNQAAWMKQLASTGKSFFHISSVQTQRKLLGEMPGGAAPSVVSRTEDALPSVVPDFSEISFEPEIMRRISTFPPLKVAYGKWQSDAGQKVFLKQRIGSVGTEYPLFYFRDYNNLRSVWLCGEGFWRWCMKEFSGHGECTATESVLFQSLQYLSVKASRRSFVLKTTKNEFESDESIALQAVWVDGAGNMDNKTACELTLQGDKGFKRVMPMAAYQDLYRVETSGLPPGQYTATARLDKSPPLLASTVFYVNPMFAEISQTQANHELLRQWAAKYKGMFVGQNRADEIIQNLNQQQAAKPVVYAETKITELIHVKWFFLFIVLCFSLEWIFRKYLGSY